MKQLVVNALVSLVSGVFLVIGIGGTIWIVDQMMSGSKPKRPHSIVYESLPPSVIIEHSVVPNVPKLTIRGSIKNSDAQRWDYVDVNVRLFVDHTNIGECRDLTFDRSLMPNETMQFLVECSSISSVNLSPNVRYEVIASRKSSRSVEK